MIIAFLGKAGAGKTTIARSLQKIVPNSFVIDGDDLRAETSNTDLSLEGRGANIHLGFSRARRLSDLGFTVFIAMQAPIKEIRDLYLTKWDIEVVVTNAGRNPKDELGYNKEFNPNYTGVDETVELTTFNPYNLYDRLFPKVIVPARFQGFHLGHKVVLEEAKRLSPNVTIGLRVDKGDKVPIDDGIKFFRDKGFNVVKTPSIEDDWVDFANNYDIFVQGNPKIIDKFSESSCKLFFVPRYDTFSGTSIRDAVAKAKGAIGVDSSYIELLKKNLK